MHLQHVHYVASHSITMVIQNIPSLAQKIQMHPSVAVQTKWSLNWACASACAYNTGLRNVSITPSNYPRSITFYVSRSYIPFAQGLRPLCLPCATTKLPRSRLKAQRRPKGCLGRSRVAQGTFRPHHGRHGRREVLSMLRLVAYRSLKGGRRKAHVSP